MLCLMFTTKVFFHYLKQKELHMIATLHIIDIMNFLEHGEKYLYICKYLLGICYSRNISGSWEPLHWTDPDTGVYYILKLTHFHTAALERFIY